jgi:hypothetical protein
MSTPLRLVSPAPASWAALIARYGDAFAQLEARSGATTWDKARLVLAFDEEVRGHPSMQGQPAHEISRQANDALRAYFVTTRQPGVGPHFMKHARRVFAVCRDMGVNTPFSLPFEAARLIAVASLPTAEKAALLTWALTARPTQRALRQEVRARLDQQLGVTRPDFPLMVSNLWIFPSDDKRQDGFHGGVNAALYANLIHYFSNYGDTVLDPFAGGGLLADVLQHYRHFRTVTAADHSGPRTALMSDISPTRPDMVQADARAGLPFGDGVAQLAILDPPYFRMARGKYAELGRSYAAWLHGLAAAVRHTARCLAPGGHLVVMVDDVLRKGASFPLGLDVLALLRAQGWLYVTVVSNGNRNYLSMSPAAMEGAKRARQLVNATKTILVVSKGPGTLHEEMTHAE